MGDRYYITGVQLGMLKAFNNFPKERLEIDKLRREIEDKQYLGKKVELNKILKKLKIK